MAQAGTCISAPTDLRTEYAIILSVVNGMLSMITSLGNALIIFALHKETSLHPPSKLLFRCLATTDLVVGLVSQPLFVVYVLSLSKIGEGWRKYFCVYSATLATITSNILCLVSLMTSTSISVDRFLSLILGLRYRQVVTFKRTLFALIVVWVVDIAFVSFSHPMYSNKTKIAVAGALCFGSLATSVFCYIKIILKIRQHQSQVQTHGNVIQENCNVGRMAMNMARYKKTVYSVVWVQLTMIICYLPYTVVVGVMSYERLTVALNTAWGITVTLVYLNSFLNPILYCWKISEVRVAVKDTLRQCCCF